MFKSAPPPPTPPTPAMGYHGVPQMQKLRAPLVGAQGYQRFPLSRPVVGLDIALDAVTAYRASTYLVVCLPGSFNFISRHISPILNSGMCFK